MHVFGHHRTVLVTIVVLVTSCVKVNTQTNYSEVFVADQSATNVVGDSLRYHPVARIEGTTLSLLLGQDEECQRVVTPVYHKVAHYSRFPTGPTFLRPAYFALAGALAAATGATVYLDANGLATSSMGNDTPSDYQNIGLVVGALGLALVTIASVDEIRLRNTDEDLGNVSHEPAITTATCRTRAASDTEISLEIPGVDWRVKGLTGADGRVQLSLTDIPEAAFHDGKTSFEVHVIGNQTFPIDGVDDGHLLGTLAANPTSRVSRERVAKAIALCTTAVGVAHDASGEIHSKPDEAVAAFNNAKSACGGYWSDDYERELTQAETSAHDIHLDQEGRDFDAALAAVVVKDRVSIDEVRLAEILLAQLGELRPPDPKLDKRMKRLIETRKRAVDVLIASAKRSLAASKFDDASSGLMVAEQISPNDPRVSRMRQVVQAESEAQARRDEARFEAQSKEEEAEEARKLGPYWHLQVICGGQPLDNSDTWERGWNGNDAKHKVCTDRCPVRDDGQPAHWCMDRCMNGGDLPSDIPCEWRATRVKCSGCQ